MPSDHYAAQLALGEAYETFVVDQLRARGIVVARHTTKHAQIAFGVTV